MFAGDVIDGSVKDIKNNKFIDWSCPGFNCNKY